MGVYIMATTILLLIIVLSVISFTPWLETMGNAQMHHTDLMAGDEGED